MSQAVGITSFQAARWVLTNDTTASITWDNVYDFDGITLTKIARIFLLTIPALVYDLARMAFHACFGTRVVQPIAAAKPPVERASALTVIPEATKQEHTDLLLEQVQHITPLAALVIAYLPREKDLEHPTQEFSIEAIFSLNKEIEDCVLAGQLKYVDWKLWKRIQTIPNAKRVVYPEIQGFDFSSADETFSNEQFLDVIKTLPHLKRLQAPAFDERVDETLIAAINILQGTLEEFHVWSGMEKRLPGDAVIQRLRECPQLTVLSLSNFLFDLNAGPNNESMIALAQKGQLKALDLSEVTTIDAQVYQAFFTLCPLEHVRIRFLYIAGLLLPDPALFRALITSRHEHLLSLDYYAYNISDDDLRLLADRCPNLQHLDIPCGYSQTSLFERLFPQWKSLRSMDFSGNFSAEQIARMVQSSPTLQKIQLGVLSSYEPEKLRVFKLLGKLGRSLMVSYSLLNNMEREKARIEQQMKEFPQIKLIRSLDENKKLFEW